MREAPERFSADPTCTPNSGKTAFWVIYGKLALCAHASDTEQSAPGPMAERQLPLSSVSKGPQSRSVECLSLGLVGWPCPRPLNDR